MLETASFGYWLRRRRKALDLTQEALARGVGCAFVTIKKIEADERRPSRRVAERLAEVLAIPDAERALFLACARGESTPLRLPLTTVPIERVIAPPHNNLPVPVAAFVGREQEVASLAGLLRQPEIRLVTLTGPGGVGKTRLALEVARTVLPGFRDGGLFVDLAPIREPERVIAAIAEAAGLKDTPGRPASAAVKDNLRDRQLLLILDNHEHLLAAAPLASELLMTAAGLKILVTSRAALHISGEHERGVLPLAAPAAAALFAARAQAVRADIALAGETAPLLAAVCRQLEALPLAIELAAARCRYWSVAELLAQLDHRLQHLTGGPRDWPARQQTLRRTLDWSYALLDQASQRLLTSLSVFVGGWMADAAVCVAAGLEGEPAVLESLLILLDHSLVQRADRSDGARYSMLETVREYAEERLVSEGAADQVHHRHLAYFLALAEALEDGVYRGDISEAAFLQRAAAEHDNFRAALTWALAGHDPAQGARLAAALTMFWYVHGHLHEGRRWLESALHLVDEPDETRAATLNGAGVLTWQQGDYALARIQIEEALIVWRRPGLGQSRGLAFALHILGHICFDQQDPDTARRLFAESLGIFQARGEDLEIMALTGDLGMVASQLGDYAEARARYEVVLAQARAQGSRDSTALQLVRLGDLARLEGASERATPMYEESLVLCREIGDVLDIAASSYKLGQVIRRKGDFERARVLLRESLALQRDQGNRQGIVECIAALAGLDLHVGRSVRAGLLFGAAEALLQELGAPLSPADQRDCEQDVADLRLCLSPANLAEAWAAGQALAARGVNHVLEAIEQP